MAESGASNEVEIKVVFKADTSELDAAKKSLGDFDSTEGSGGSSGLDETAEAAGEAEEKLEDLNENLEETGEKLEDLKEKTEEAAENLGALGENTETVGENLESLGEQADAAAQNLEDLSDNAEETGDNLSEAGEAAEDVGSVLEDLSDNAENAADQISAVGDAANDTADGVKEAGEAADQISEGFNSAGDAAEKAAESLQSTGDAAKDTADDLGSIGDSVGELSDSLSDISEAGEDAGDNLGSIGENAADAADNLSEINDAVEDTSENLGGIGDAADDAADNVSKIGDAAGDAESSLGSLADNAGDAADQIGDVGSSGQDAADGVEDISDAADDAGGHFEKIISLLEEISQKLDSAGSAARTTGEEVKKAGDEAEKSVDTFKDFSEAIGKFESLGNGLKGFSNSLIDIGKDAVATAGEFEQLKAKLETIQKSSETASQTFEYAKSLAASTPFDVKGVVNAAVQLEVYGQNSKELLPVVANLASAMGGDLSAAATAFGRALSGSSEGLQSLRDSFGVNTDKLVKFGAALNKQGGIAVDSAENVEKLKKALVGLVNTEFAGGIERQASTVAGAMANVEDAITETKAAIGAEFAPYVVIASEHVGNLLESLKGFAPVIAVVGGLAAATTGLAGSVIAAGAGVVGLTAACSALSAKYSELIAQTNALKASNKWASMALGTVGGVASAAAILGTAAYIYLEKVIADEKKAQAEIAAQSKALVQQRQNWDDLRKAVEGATGAKVKFSAGDNTPGAQSISDIVKNTPGVMLKDELAKYGWTQDKIENEVEARKKEVEKSKELLREALNKASRFDDIKLSREDAGFVNPEAEAENVLGYTREDARNEIENFKKRLRDAEDKLKEIKSIPDKFDADTKHIVSAEKNAASELAYADFAVKAKDANALTDSIEGCRKALASLYEAGKGQTVLSDAQLKDPTERLQRMGQLMRSGQENNTEFNYLKSIKDLEEKLKESYKTQKELRQQDLKDAEQAFNEQLSRERAGHEQSLDEERAYWETLLEARKGERQRLASAYETDLRRHKNGFNPGDREYLQGEIDNLQHLSPGEIEAINKLHELDKKQTAESFSSLITPLREAADELSSKVTAKPADQVAAWKLVVDKAKEWGQTNAQILAQSPELKKQFESDLKGIETEYKRVQEAAANTALTNLSEKVSEKIGSVSSQTSQLDAVREAERLYQQTLRTSKELQASDAARQQAQKQLNSLKQQELKIIEQIKETQKQVENETASLEVQIEEERLAAMQDRANSGEDMSKQILAQEQKIQEMRLQQLEEAKKQELEMHAGTSEESARLRLAIEKKYQDKIVLLNMQYQRKLAQEQRSFSDKQSKLKNRDGLKPESKKEETSWKPGSPIMTLQDMLTKHNQWFANAGSDFEDAAAKTNTMSGAAENASDKLFKLAGSAEAAASGLAGSGGSAAAGSAGAGATDSAAFYASGFRYANSAALPSARDVYFPSAGQFGSTVHADRISESSINNVRNVNNSTYNVNFGNKATSVNAVDVSAITNRTARIVMQKINNQNRHNSIY